MRRSFLYALLAVVTAALTVLAVRPALSATGRVTPAATGPVRIMPLGDSITAGPGCWRAMLWHQLQTSGYTNIDFVGSVADGGCNYGYTYDGDNEGHGGYAATGIADNNQLPPWLDAARPDIVLMHLGTNDMWGGTIPTSTILAAYTKLVDQMRASNPAMKIVVAQIIPMNPPSCPTCAAGVVALDNAIPSWAAGLSTAQSPIVVVDQWTGFDTVADTVGDGVHPNDSGFQKMANRWYPALASLLGPPSTASPSPPPPGACTATYQLVSQWTGGFQGQVTVANSGTSAVSSWTATLTFTGGQQVTQSWNATVTQNQATVTAHNVGWNGALAPGASTSFGFLASTTGANPAPAVSCTAT
jgi:lysophospholipase L1-like esterase